MNLDHDFFQVSKLSEDQKMEHFFPRFQVKTFAQMHTRFKLLGGMLMKTILKLLGGDTVKLLGGYIPPIPPGFCPPAYGLRSINYA